MSLIVQPISDASDNIIHTKKNAKNPTLNIEAIEAVEISIINIITPTSNVPIIDANKHPPVLQIHPSNPLHFPNAFAPNNNIENTTIDTAVAINETIAKFTIFASNPLVKTTPAIIPSTMLISNSIMHVPLQNLLQVYSSIFSSPPLFFKLIFVCSYYIIFKLTFSCDISLFVLSIFL